MAAADWVATVPEPPRPVYLRPELEPPKEPGASRWQSGASSWWSDDTWTAGSWQSEAEDTGSASRAHSANSRGHSANWTVAAQDWEDYVGQPPWVPPQWLQDMLTSSALASLQGVASYSREEVQILVGKLWALQGEIRDPNNWVVRSAARSLRVLRAAQTSGQPA